MDAPILLLAWALLAGCAAGGLACSIRVFVASVRPAWAKVKPWGCSTCMSWWSSFVTVPAAAYALGFGSAISYRLTDGLAVAIVLFASTGIGAWLGAVAVPPPFDLPDVEE